MKMQGKESVNLTKVLYIPQAFKNLLSVSMLVSKGDTMGATKDKMTINKKALE